MADFAGYDDVELGLELAEIQLLLGGLQLPKLGIDTPELDRLFGLGARTLGNEDSLEPGPSRRLRQTNVAPVALAASGCA